MRFCLYPPCKVRVERGGYCSKHAPDRESNRPNVDVRRWYRTPRWRALRARKLNQQPYCNGQINGQVCGGRTTDVDHVVPHRGDPLLFWDAANLEALCHRCHSAKTGRGF